MTTPDPNHRLIAWFLKWRLPLRKFLTAKGAVPASDLDDVAQEVFLRLMRYGRMELIEHPQAYLYKMASNVAAEWALRGRYLRSGEPAWLGAVTGAQEVEDQAGALELQDQIEQALLTLTPQQREVLKLQFYAGLSRTEIARRLNLSERSVKRALVKSYEKLRTRLNTESLSRISDGRE
jgi:RNA polymerase sigma factor (sigma-70 family)